MNIRGGEAALIGAGLGYLLVLGWAIGSVSYDVWGALVVAPVCGVLGIWFVRRMFRGDLRPLALAMTWGLVFKLAGALARYWVGFEAYSGEIDANRYHDFAAAAARDVWSGRTGFTSVLPHGLGTEFMLNLTAFVYTLTGTSQLAGFITFSFLAYIGTVLIVKAAAIAVPGLASRRYAWMCVLWPSVVYWPSSIGKEAPIMLGLGVAVLGIAVLFAYGQWVAASIFVAAGLGFTSLIRPHIASIFFVALLPALVVALLRRSGATGDTNRTLRIGRWGVAAALVLAAIGLSMAASVTVRFLSPDSDAVAVDNLTMILESTTRRTSDDGSTFTPPSLSNPVRWPYASLRTLLRPLPYEAQNIAQLVAAAEVSALVIVLIASRRRLANLPRLLITSPFVTFAVATVLLTGLAYASFGNLGLLTRQKSLVFPFMLLLACVPARTWRLPTPEQTTDQQPMERARPTPTRARRATASASDIDELWA